MSDENEPTELNELDEAIGNAILIVKNWARIGGFTDKSLEKFKKGNFAATARVIQDHYGEINNHIDWLKMLSHHAQNKRDDEEVKWLADRTFKYAHLKMDLPIEVKLAWNIEEPIKENDDSKEQPQPLTSTNTANKHIEQQETVHTVNTTVTVNSDELKLFDDNKSETQPCLSLISEPTAGSKLINNKFTVDKLVNKVNAKLLDVTVLKFLTQQPVSCRLWRQKTSKNSMLNAIDLFNKFKRKIFILNNANKS